MNYLDFVVEHSTNKATKEHKINLFEKVLAASKRARDLHEDKTPTIPELANHKHTSSALYEVLHGKIKLVQHVPVLSDIDDDDDDEEEEDDADAARDWKGTSKE